MTKASKHCIMVDSGAGKSACPRDYANDCDTVEGGSLLFTTASGEQLPHWGSRSVVYQHDRAGQLGVTYEVTNVHEPVASVSAMNDAGYTVVFSPEGS